MKYFSQEEFDSFEIKNGHRICPTGDYSRVTEFSEECSFGEGCSFGADCSFGEECSFGVDCSFGEWCNFGVECSFGERCRFGRWSKVEGHVLKGFKSRSLEGLGKYKRKLVVWDTEDGFYAQAGCFFGTGTEFLAAVELKYGEDSSYEQAYQFLTTFK